MREISIHRKGDRFRFAHRIGAAVLAAAVMIGWHAKAGAQDSKVRVRRPVQVAMAQQTQSSSDGRDRLAWPSRLKQSILGRGGARAQDSEIAGLHKRSLREYDAGDLSAARKTWAEILAKDPNNRQAQVWLELTEEGFEQSQAAGRERQSAEESAEKRRRLMNSPVTIQTTEGPMPLSEFMKFMSFSTVEDIEYYLAPGAADTPIYGNFIQRPLRDILDTILVPTGLTWEMDPNNLIVIKPQLRTVSFNVTTPQVNRLKTLMGAGALGDVVWGQAQPPVTGARMSLDDREGVFLLTGSETHLRNFASFLASLDTAERPDMDVAIFKINEDDGPRLRTMINAIIGASSDTPFELEREVYIDGSNMIVRDTPLNIAKIEDLLLDEEFVRDIREEVLDIKNFDLIPRTVEDQSNEQIAVSTQHIVDAVKVFLYARDGVESAQAEGRHLWYDQATMQLTIVDTPTNIVRVASYIRSLPQLAQEQKQETLFITMTPVSQLVTELAEILGLSGASIGGTGVAGGEVKQIRLRRGEQFTFRDMRITLLRVEEGDPNDRNDDEITLQVITGSQTSTISVRELETTSWQNYLITAEDVQPAGGGGGGGVNTRRGEGRATIIIEYIPPIEDELR